MKIIDREGQIIISQLHKIKKGAVEGAVDIPKETMPGKYTMSVYTTRMLQRPYDNYAEKFVYLLNDKAKSIEALNDSIQIRIEGGVLISGGGGIGLLSIAQ